MNKKTFVTTLLAVTLLLSGCSTYKANDNDADVAQSTVARFSEKYKSIGVDDSKIKCTCIMFGVFTEICTLTGSNEVVFTTIMPVNKGGVYYEDYGYRTAFAPSELFEDIGKETRISDVDGTTLPVTEPTRYWKLMMESDDCSGDLPEFVASAEEVHVDDIPKWYGA